ncbi:MAG: hypothetical protein NTW32_21430 [Chloroflexi bacterium]|nr:hypothetical protein [Chloroflexota bacterium]
MEQAIATLIQNAAISALSLTALAPLAPALWFALMAIREAPCGFGATLAVAHYNK